MECKTVSFLLLSVLFFVAFPSFETKILDHDRGFMRRALGLARNALGRTHPNPCVGCVIVNDKMEIVGEGYHVKCGEPHAEVNALRMAGEAARGCTAYVTLEPCNHFGRTPPCSLALIKHGIKRVVAGLIDTDPRVGGQGLARLQQHNISTEIMDGEEHRLCRDINVPFFHRIRCGRPFVTTCSLPHRLLQSDQSLRDKIANELEGCVGDMDTIVLSLAHLPPATSATTFLHLLDHLFPSYMHLLVISNEDTIEGRELLQQDFQRLTTRRVVVTNSSLPLATPSTTPSTNINQEVVGVNTEIVRMLGQVYQSNGLVMLQFDEEEEEGGGGKKVAVQVTHCEEESVAVQRLVKVFSM